MIWIFELLDRALLWLVLLVMLSLRSARGQWELSFFVLLSTPFIVLYDSSQGLWMQAAATLVYLAVSLIVMNALFQESLSVLFAAFTAFLITRQTARFLAGLAVELWPALLPDWAEWILFVLLCFALQMGVALLRRRSLVIQQNAGDPISAEMVLCLALFNLIFLTGVSMLLPDRLYLRYLQTCFALLAVLFSYLPFSLYNTLLWHRRRMDMQRMLQKELREQTSYVRVLEKQEHMLQVIRHDHANVLCGMRQLMEEGEREMALEMVREYRKRLENREIVPPEELGQPAEGL